MKPLLVVRNLSFSYPRRHLFNGWSAEFHAGITWLAGPNGCGKSTLLMLLAGALPPLLGTRIAAGFDADQQPIDYRREVFWCGRGGVPFDHLDIVEYIGFMRSLYPRFDAAIANQHLQGFGLVPHLGKRLATLSTGTQRKVWLSAAFAAQTPVVLVDEPLNALDAASLTWLRSALDGCATRSDQAWLIASHERVGSAHTAVRRLAIADGEPGAAPDVN